LLGKKRFHLFSDFLIGRKKCIFCGSFKVRRTVYGEYVQCSEQDLWKRKTNVAQTLGAEKLPFLTSFYQQQPAYRVPQTQIQRMRSAIFYVIEFEAGKLKEEKN